jgi:hypothetical protein
MKIPLESTNQGKDYNEYLQHMGERSNLFKAPILKLQHLHYIHPSTDYQGKNTHNTVQRWVIRNTSNSGMATT